ncbi:MAG: rod shape-determining protein RodA [Verrucomicrobia subdivision 3 bacterium]|nr:rod shape-determining protein RodA [Limisphaerales bacterium]
MIALGQERQSKIDWLLLAALAGLMTIGLAFIYSATMVTEAAQTAPWYRQRWILQIVWYLAGISAAVILCLIDYHILARWSFVAYWVTILFLLAVLIPGVGAMRFGARRWIDLGFFQIQPSEFVKLSFIFAQAHFLSRPADELRLPIVFWKALGMLGLPFVLVMKEPDLGSALILIPIGLTMMFAAGVPIRYLRNLVIGAGLLVVLILVDVLFAPPNWQIKLEDYQKRRLLVYFGRDFVPPNATPAERAEARRAQRNYSYNVDQAMISVGSGGVFGKGWGKGTQNALGYLPRAVAHNDFIFSVIAEEKGFLGSVVVIALYSIVLFTGIRIAGQTRDRLGKLLAVGVVAMLFSHVFINIGMNIRLMPVTGVPLPLLSYGGSSVLCSLIAAGILQNVYIYRRSY